MSKSVSSWRLVAWFELLPWACTWVKPLATSAWVFLMTGGDSVFKASCLPNIDGLPAIAYLFSKDIIAWYVVPFRVETENLVFIALS